MGVPPDDPTVRRGANWLLSVQQACGGWGESADSYERPELRGQGPCTPSQTAWALLGLMAASRPLTPSGASAALEGCAADDADRDVAPSRREGATRREGAALPIERGIRYLIDTQNPDGSWDEPEFTGTGFPRVFYLRYHYYRIYFPLLALTAFQHKCGLRSTECGMLGEVSGFKSEILNPKS
jgi:squalene-hopene/tetraprenyl-beta-curcumene cyclase